MSEGLLKQHLHDKIREGNGKVSFAFGISPIVDMCLADLLRGQPELSPQTLRWLKNWFGFDAATYKWERCDCGVKILEAKETKGGQ